MTEVVLPCDAIEGTDDGSDWLPTFEAIAIRCGAYRLHVNLATYGNCITHVVLLEPPYPSNPASTPESITSCATETLLRTRWACIPRDRWSEYQYRVLELM